MEVPLLMYNSLSVSMRPADPAVNWPEKPTIFKIPYKRWRMHLRAVDGRYVTIYGLEGMDYHWFLAELEELFYYITF